MYTLRQADGVEEVDALTDMFKVTLEGCPVPDFGCGWWWIAWDGEAPVAFAGMRESSAYLKSSVFLCAAGVMPSDRGHGLQKRLIRAREMLARRMGFKIACTYTVTDNPVSSNNLIKCGFNLFWPRETWVVRNDALYWKKELRA